MPSSITSHDPIQLLDPIRFSTFRDFEAWLLQEVRNRNPAVIHALLDRENTSRFRYWLARRDAPSGSREGWSLYDSLEATARGSSNAPYSGVSSGRDAMFNVRDYRTDVPADSGIAFRTGCLNAFYRAQREAQRLFPARPAFGSPYRHSEYVGAVRTSTVGPNVPSFMRTSAGAASTTRPGQTRPYVPGEKGNKNLPSWERTMQEQQGTYPYKLGPGIFSQARTAAEYMAAFRSWQTSFRNQTPKVSTSRRSAVRDESSEQFWKEHVEYLASPAWAAKRQQYQNSGRAWVCSYPGCGCTSGLQLHHLTYRRHKNEALDDLMPLCGHHHDRITDYMRAGNLPNYLTNSVLRGQSFAQKEFKDAGWRWRGMVETGAYWDIRMPFGSARINGRAAKDQSLAQLMNSEQGRRYLAAVWTSWVEAPEGDKFWYDSKGNRKFDHFISGMQRLSRTDAWRDEVEPFYGYLGDNLSPMDSNLSYNPWDRSKTHPFQMRQRSKDMWMEGKGVERVFDPSTHPAGMQTTQQFEDYRLSLQGRIRSSMTRGRWQSDPEDVKSQLRKALWEEVLGGVPNVEKGTITGGLRARVHGKIQLGGVAGDFWNRVQEMFQVGFTRTAVEAWRKSWVRSFENLWTPVIEDLLKTNQKVEQLSRGQAPVPDVLVAKAARGPGEFSTGLTDEKKIERLLDLEAIERDDPRRLSKAQWNELQDLRTLSEQANAKIEGGFDFGGTEDKTRIDKVSERLEDPGADISGLSDATQRMMKANSPKEIQQIFDNLSDDELSQDVLRAMDERKAFLNAQAIAQNNATAWNAT